MSDILRDLSTTSLITAIEENLPFVIPAFQKWPRADVHDEADIRWSMTDIPFPLLNSIFRARLAPETIDATIGTIIGEARSRNVPVLWWTGPATQPADLGRHLERHGFVSEGQMTGMAVDLANLNENLPAPPGLTAQLVRGDEALKLWSQAGALGFGTAGFVAEAFYEFMRHQDSDTVLPYLGWLNGKPVATSLLTLATGVAGIYNVATIPEARRKGIASIMTLLPLREARTRGHQVGVLQASAMGASVYRRLGFQEYCQIGQYVWSPTPADDGAAYPRLQPTRLGYEQVPGASPERLKSSLQA